MGLFDDVFNFVDKVMDEVIELPEKIAEATCDVLENTYNKAQEIVDYIIG